MFAQLSKHPFLKLTTNGVLHHAASYPTEGSHSVVQQICLKCLLGARRVLEAGIYSAHPHGIYIPVGEGRHFTDNHPDKYMT